MTIPQTRVPFLYTKFDPSNAFQGPALLKYRALFIGQRTSTGTVAEKIITKITSADEAGLKFGVGSMLHRMAISWFSINKITEIYMVALDDDGSGVQATGTFTITGPATANGTIAFYVHGERIEITVTSGDTPTIIGDALVAAITADTSLAITAANVTGVVTSTAKNAGEAGNFLDLRVNMADGEALPAGVGITTVAMASGATNPDIQDIIDIWGDTWYHVIASPLNDATNLTAIETELKDRAGEARMIDGLYITAQKGTVGSLGTFGNGRNSPYVCCPHMQLVPTYIGDYVAAWAANIAQSGEIHPSVPFQTSELTGILAPAESERFSSTENDTLLHDGISTFSVDQAGKMRIQRAITMYQLNDAGFTDIAYLNVNTILQLMYIRYDWNNFIGGKYAQALLVSDTTILETNVKAFSPTIAKSEAITKFKQWQKKGLVENLAQFKQDLQAEIDATDPDRCNITMSPDLANQFRVGATIIKFLLQGNF